MERASEEGSDGDEREEEVPAEPETEGKQVAEV